MTDQTTRLPVRRALISVSDKTGILEFARGLAAHGVEILSTRVASGQTDDGDVVGRWLRPWRRTCGYRRAHRNGER